MQGLVLRRVVYSLAIAWAACYLASTLFVHFREKVRHRFMRQWSDCSTSAEEGGCLTVKKQFVKRKPITWYALLALGSKALSRRLDALRGIFRSASPDSRL